MHFSNYGEPVERIESVKDSWTLFWSFRFRMEVDNWIVHKIVSRQLPFYKTLFLATIFVFIELFSFQMFSRSKIHLYFSKESDIVSSWKVYISLELTIISCLPTKT